MSDADVDSQHSPRSIAATDVLSPSYNAFCTPPATGTMATPQIYGNQDISMPEKSPSQSDDHANDDTLAVMSTSKHRPSIGAMEHISPLQINPDLFMMTPAPQSKELYINSDGARLPKIRRLNSMRDERLRPRPPPPDHGSICFPTSRLNTPELEDRTLRTRSFIQPDTWEELKSRFESYCLTPSALFPSYTSSQFPARSDIDTMIAGYFDSFHQTVPIVHLPTLTLEPAAWLLALGLAAAGCHFLNGASKFQYINAMHEFLQRALVFAAEQDDRSPEDFTIVAKLLHSIGMMFSGRNGSVDKARRWRADLATAYKRLCDGLASRNLDVPADRDEIIVMTAWLQWTSIEQCRRLVYAIWMIDSMWSYLLGDEAFLSAQLSDVPLPCAEVLWDASSSKQWREVIELSDQSSSLKTAVERIFVHREVQSTLGEYSRILLIHGLYHHMRYIKSLLTSDTSWSSIEPDRGLAHPVPWWTWPPTQASYHKWREAACDCLDILHWRANSVIGAASGLEHPTVAHLHLARIILLTPIDDIQTFARMTARRTIHDSEKYQALINRVRAWAQQDCYKARLAIIHAGVSFWHLRRFSVGAFYETQAVVLAALTLWAFAIFAERPPIHVFTPGTPGTTSSASNNPLPASINLDRPCDDELVQSFIQEGTRIPAMIGGVGEICSERGPSRILVQALEILQAFDNWGITTEATHFMSELAQIDLSGMSAS